jgi:hypothetical protein
LGKRGSKLSEHPRKGGWKNMAATATSKVHPGVGDAAPAFIYQDGAGNKRRLSELWGEGPALIVWLRHFG